MEDEVSFSNYIQLLLQSKIC